MDRNQGRTAPQPDRPQPGGRVRRPSITTTTAGWFGRQSPPFEFHRVPHDRNVKKRNYRFCRVSPYLHPPKPIDLSDRTWRIPMKTTMLAAFATLGLGVAAANAQGLGAGAVPPVYGSQAFTQHNEPQAHFLGQGTVFAKLFGHSQNDQAAANKAAELKTTSAKGG
jgi:hypothetical protein